MSRIDYFNLEFPAACNRDDIRIEMKSFLSDLQSRSDVIPRSLLRGEFILDARTLLKNYYIATN
jgi:hypothetical protein